MGQPEHASRHTAITTDRVAELHAARGRPHKEEKEQGDAPEAQLAALGGEVRAQQGVCVIWALRSTGAALLVLLGLMSSRTSRREVTIG